MSHTGHAKGLGGSERVRRKLSEVGPEPDKVEVEQGVVQGGETHDAEETRLVPRGGLSQDATEGLGVRRVLLLLS